MSIKYIGSKRTLIPQITGLIASVVPTGSTVLDLFSGTSRVGIALRGAGYQVWANDSATYAYRVADAYIRGVWTGRMDKAIEYLNALPPSPGYVTKTFCEDARFFQSGNGGKIDAIREEIAGWYTTGGISENEMSMLLVSLMEAADRVDSTVGLQMAYLKDWAKRSFNPLELRPLEIPEGPVGWASRCNALEFVSAAASDYIFDLVYIDPPYNQHSYLSNYHIWESLCLWDKPETYGVAQKRIDCRTRKSPYNSKKTALAELERVVSALRCRYALLSFNNEGFISLDTMEAVLSRYGNLSTYEVDHDRYVGAKIGVHNLKGEKVGTVGKLKNKEYLYLLGK